VRGSQEGVVKHISEVDNPHQEGTNFEDSYGTYLKVIRHAIGALTDIAATVSATREQKEQAMQELNSGSKPALKTKVNRIGSYDVIFVGTPIWWGTLAAPVKSFLSEYDVSGKTVVPFVTHAGSGLGRSVLDIAALCPHSTIQDGLAVWGKNANTAQNDVSTWVRKLDVKG